MRMPIAATATMPSPPTSLSSSCSTSNRNHHVTYQIKPVAMVIASSRAGAEDACERVNIEFEPLEVACDAETALEPSSPVIHPEFGSNLAWERLVDVGDVDSVYARDDITVVERRFVFGRHTGVTLEPRAAIFEFNPSDETLIYHYNGQAPHMMQAILAKHLGLEDADVRVIARNVGRSFGIKIHTGVYSYSL